jgi:hypothetical protein
MIIKLMVLFVVAFIQNMAFTLVSRSRNSGDPKRHFKAALGSNSIWFFCNYFILFPELMKIINDGNIWLKIIFMAVYVTATSLGSVFMMNMNLGKINIPYITPLFVEKDKSQVGKR